MPWWMELVVRFHKGEAVVSRSVWSTVAQLALDDNWYRLLESGWDP